MKMDKKAKSILFNTYWTSKGWIDRHLRVVPNKSDFNYAKTHGLMFDNVTMNHDECLKELSDLINVLDKKKVTDAFLSSLSTRRLDWRSALGSYANAIKFINHAYTQGTDLRCKICHCYDNYDDEDINVLNFERIKWSGVRHNDILYNLIDLQILMTLDIPEPTENDYLIFNQLLEIIDASQATDKPNDLLKNTKNVLNSNAAERQQLLEIMGCADILQPQIRKAQKNEWHFIGWWRGKDKYNLSQLTFYFRQYADVHF